MRFIKIENIIFVCFLLFIIIDAFGRFNRYPIAEQLGISINFLKYGYFFPDFNGKDFYVCWRDCCLGFWGLMDVFVSGLLVTPSIFGIMVSFSICRLLMV